MRIEEFEKASREVFAFLERDFGFRLLSAESGGPGLCHLTYANDVAFVRLKTDVASDRHFNLLVGPLVRGSIPPEPLFLEREDEPLTWYPLWAIMRVRGADEPRFSGAIAARFRRIRPFWHSVPFEIVLTGGRRGSPSSVACIVDCLDD